MRAAEALAGRLEAETHGLITSVLAVMCVCVCVCVCIDRSMDRWINRSIDRWMDGWMDGDGWIGGGGNTA